MPHVYTAHVALRLGDHLGLAHDCTHAPKRNRVECWAFFGSPPHNFVRPASSFQVWNPSCPESS